MQLITNDALVSPVTSSELVDWARLDSDDPTIAGLLIASTAAAISFLKQDLIQRTWTLTHHDWPTVGTDTYPSISRNNYKYKTRIELPMANLISVTSVEVTGVAETEYETIKGKPYSLEFDTVALTDNDSPALEIVYEAGFGATEADVPAPIKQAILMIATYMHSHNGACDYTDAISMSGAKALLVPYAVNGGIVL